MGYKAGMTTIVRDLDRPGAKMHKKEIVEAVTVIETPPVRMTRTFSQLATNLQFVPDDGRRSSWLYRNPTRPTISHYCLGRAFERRGQAKVLQKLVQVKEEGLHPISITRELERIKKYCTVVRILAHTQIRQTPLKQKKAHLMEIQVNGGTIPEKVEFGHGLFEKPVEIDTIFEQDEMIDCIAVTKGHGFQGVTSRWGTKKLPRKTHKGLRKVACIGAWHPSHVQWTVARAGQDGYHHRTSVNHKVYRIGKGKDEGNAATEFDVNKKTITP
jgi:large subunit ribosomal protein L3e